MYFTLTLSPQFGGTAFGPFQPGTVALGSDNRRCQIVLPANLGVRPVHCTITLMATGEFALQLGEQGVGLYFFVKNKGQAQAVRSAATLRPGDSFAINNPGGPRFIVGMYSQEQPQAGGVKLGGRTLPTAGQMRDEIKRQANVNFTTNKIGGAVQTFFYRLSSGAYFQPRYILGAMVAVFGVLMTGCVGLLQLLKSLAG
ncbi:MAG: hypothetical protein H6741_15775 [Alphaproteobacteria bacterium]|nr:hypothetical protein [Alphaproteobacteria bacterium]